MLRTLGPSGLLRLATAIALGLSLLTGCTAAVGDRPLAAAMETDDSHGRCHPDPSAAALCLQP